MPKIFITGCGLTTPSINNLKDLSFKRLSDFNLEAIDYESSMKRKFSSRSYIAKEDRSLLSDDSKSLMDAAKEAYESADLQQAYSEEEKNCFPLFVANETSPENFDEFFQFMKNFSNQRGGLDEYEMWSSLGRLRKYFNPLDMLRRLSTNPLYHVSKLLGLHGGGYPIRRMSLSSLCALEEAIMQMDTVESRALVAATGNATIPSIYSVFDRMGLIKSDPNSIEGILPSSGAASVILEKQFDEDNNRKKLAEVIVCKTLYKSDNAVTLSDWDQLYKGLTEKIDAPLSIVSYDNGNKDISTVEKIAIQKYFPSSNIHNYKQYLGYTGKSNNLIDLVMAINDKDIEKGNYVLINGFGHCSGIGFILIKKLGAI